MPEFEKKAVVDDEFTAEKFEELKNACQKAETKLAVFEADDKRLTREMDDILKELKVSNEEQADEKLKTLKKKLELAHVAIETEAKLVGLMEDKYEQE